jgi:hypothetical protein
MHVSQFMPNYNFNEHPKNVNPEQSAIYIQIYGIEFQSNKNEIKKKNYTAVTLAIFPIS